MARAAAAKRKDAGQAARPPFERIALLLQGGGALGAYQGGVYQALAEHDVLPDTVAGVSIGAINAALIAGNPPERRVAALRSFWERITAPPFGFPFVSSFLGLLELYGDKPHEFLNQSHAMVTAAGGAPGFFRPRAVPPFLAPRGTAAAESLYDTSPLRDTLEELVDFDRLNNGETWFSVGAVNVRSGNLEWFDSSERRIAPEHIMASGALPPAFAAVEIEGEAYWDGGLVSNTPLQWVLDSNTRKDTLAFQVDLWSARGDLPLDVFGLDLREKDIRFSSRTRASTDQFRATQRARHAVRRLLDLLPDRAVLADPAFSALVEAADDKVFNIVHLIYRAKSYEGSFKDYEFSRATMEAHWAAGHGDATRTLAHPQVLRRPISPDGVATFDLTEPESEPTPT
ncbi:patatin-like phospholipase family protein [Amaricoccus sp.]|uniref:patatin-like phospholipase family protein n=1 Tax=Amaricoccus sp. TaxID=1872485 RepID=UPI002612BC50|nr:patatin-like phospholipase family protein [uncultured Amaricoccus sp.]